MSKEIKKESIENKFIHDRAVKGGLAISQNREHMAAIGRLGGLKISQNREHMAAIGKKGGLSNNKSSKGLK